MTTPRSEEPDHGYPKTIMEEMDHFDFVAKETKRGRCAYFNLWFPLNEHYNDTPLALMVCGWV